MTQRTILFRGKRIIDGEWVEGMLFYTGYSEPTKFGLKPCIQVCDFQKMTYSASHEVDPATVGQFTGLTDKNGVNIFEGDCFGNDNIPIRHVVFEDGKFCFNRTHSQGADVLSQDRIGRLEIIGNIHTK